MRFALPMLLLGLAAVTAVAADPQLHVGFGECDVSPTVDGKAKVYLAGFGHDRLATKVHDPILARAVVLSDGKQKLALACVDVVGLFLPTVEQVRGKLKGFDYVLVSSTHNHEGPDTLGLWGSSPLVSGVDAAYQKKVIDGVVTAIRAAEKGLAAATAKVGTAKGPELLHDGREPYVLHDDIVVLRFDGTNSTESKPLGLVVQWNCHPETLDDKNTAASADFVHYTVEHLKKKYGCPVAYFTGTVGGLMTSLEVPLKNAKGELLKDGTWEKTEAYGVAVGKLAETAEAAAVPATLVPFAVRTKTLLVPVENNGYRLLKTLGVIDRDMFDWAGDPRPKEFRPAKVTTRPLAIKTEVGYLKLGELEVAAIPGEIYPELVLDKVQTPADKGADFPDAAVEPAVYTQLKGKHRMLVGLANDEIGYILPKRQWDEQKPYCYGRKEAQYGEINSCGPEVAKVICEAFRDLAANK